MSSKTKTTATKEEPTPTLVPKLRFPVFREAEGWEKSRLSEITSAIFDGTHQTPKYTAEGIPFYSVENLISGNANKFISRGDYELATKKNKPEQGDILITRIGKIGHSEVVTWSHEFSIYVTLAVIKQGPRFNSHFLHHYLQSGHYQKEILSKSLLNAVPCKINMDSLRATHVLLASPAEQQKIAECLSSVDELIAAQARKLDALKTHKKGLMQQLFPREGETQPRLRFPEFQNAGEWVESPLSKFILSLDAGVSVNSGDRPAGKTEFGVLKTSAVTNGIFEPDENKVVFAEDEQARLKEPVSGGTIIISRMNTPALVGANAYVESSHENLFLPDRLWAAKPREGVSMRFLALILGSDKGRAALSKLAKGSSGTMKNITKPDVLSFSLMAPSAAEQQRIADCLSCLDDLIAAQTQTLEALKTHKQGLMQQLFPSPAELAV